MYWVNWSNPVAVWWCFLVAVSAVNVAAWFFIFSRWRDRTIVARAGALAIEPLILLGAAYAFGCAFRSALPRADVQRICLFDTWLSSVMVGRSVATVAELCFVLQWAIVLRILGNIANSDTAKNVSSLIMPLIALAECCSWYAVITTDYLGNVFENSLWTVTFLLIGLALLRLLFRFHGRAQWIIAAATLGITGYVVFMCSVDVPMYLARWQADAADGKTFLGLAAGLHDVATRWIVTHDAAQWRGEFAWMALYFSAAVWASLALASVALVRHLLPRYHRRDVARLLLPPPRAVPAHYRIR